MIEHPRDKAGDRYEHFTCSGRRRKTTNCTRSAILAERAEAEIEHTYQRKSLSPTQAEHVRKVLNDVFDQLEAERLKLVQAHYADAIPLDLLKKRARPHPRQPRPDQHTARQPHRHLRRRPNGLGPAHRTPRRPRRPLQQVRTSRTTHPQPRPVHPHHHRRRRERDLLTRRDHRQRPCPHQHRRPGARHRRNKTAPPSGGAVL